MRRTVTALAVAAALSVPVAGARAQWDAIEVWGGMARNSPSWGVLGEVPAMNFGMVGVRLSRVIGGERAGSARVTEFTLDVVPVAMTSPPYVSLRDSGYPCAPRSLCVVQPARGTGDVFPSGSAVGFGVNPAGLTWRFRRGQRFSPSVGFTVGGLLFDRPVPTSRAAQFNFTAAAEAGVRFGPPDRPGITIHYRLHHISNAGTAGENPGLASHLVSVGIHNPRRRTGN
jgi:hypothetical protein